MLPLKPLCSGLDDMDIVLISDTHELHRELDLPAGDVLIHAGDFTMLSRSLAAIRDFNSWLGELPYEHKLVVPGNHEFFLEADQSQRNLLSNAIVLIDEGVEIDGMRFWGSPLTPSDGGAFGRILPADRVRNWSRIPQETHILITHGPPCGILDRSPGQREHVGDPELLTAVSRIRPLLHVFGHVHGAYGSTVRGDTTFVNAALLGAGGDLQNAPINFRFRELERS